MGRQLAPRDVVSECLKQSNLLAVSKPIGTYQECLVTPVISMQLMNGRLGHFVDFTLPVSLPSEYRIHWNFGYAGKVTVIVMFETGEPAQYNPLYKGRWKCFYLMAPNLMKRIVWFKQSMLSAPVLKSNSPLISGTNVTLHCDAGNQNVTTYTFYHNQNIISSESRVTSRGSFLDYKPISENDSGSYSCTIQNPISSSTSNSIIVTVSVPVSSVTLTSDTSGLLWPGIDLVSLHCSARGTNVSYSWSMDDEPLPENPRYRLSQNNSKLIINPVSSNDSGPLRCAASNWVNVETSSKLNLNLGSMLSAPVLKSNSPLISGTNVTLHCDAGNQTVTAYTFYHNQNIISSESRVTSRGSFLDYKPISENDSGSYSCTIQNPISSSTSNSIIVTVSVPVSSVTLTSDTSGLLWPGIDLVSLHCSARGTNVSYSWSMDDEPLPENPRYRLSQNNSKLIINPVSSNDSGPLRCAASNWVNVEISSKLNLNLGSMLSAPVLKSNSPLISGTNVTLHCDAGNQTVTAYTFYHNQNIISSESRVTSRGSFLDYKPISENDSGSYSCTIQNPISSSTSNSIIVTVSVPVSSVTLTSDTSGLLWPGIDLVSLHCSARGTNVSYSWSMDDEPLPENPRYRLSQNNSTLIINPVSSNDSGPLRCAASNWVNVETSSKLNLNLGSSVSAVMLSSSTSRVLWAGKDSVSLYCSAQGSAITFSWSLNGKPVTPNPPYYITQSDSPQKSTLTISPVSKNDTGPFTCSASNLINSETSNELTLGLNWYPKGNIGCIVQGHDSLLQLDCNWPGGHPAANVTMIFNNIEEMGQSKVTRNVSLTQNSQRSTLTCIGGYLGKTFSCVLTFMTPQLPQDKNNAVTAVMKGGTTNSKTKGLP
ncbi:carcinoembryonic antigen-related cell adhesion molecule 5-like [Eleutherodactylus coqui]|uniref:carcinoembryonic antigen-related cell adhesion molecule 5-like n=1 Tax=Eleutherodactylus coqui TaxID=57060 RepID=UPI0034633B9E